MDVGTRKRKYPHPCSLELTPDLIIRKILYHSGDPSSPRLLKYLGHAKRTFSSSNLKLWSDLRTKGVLDKMETIIRSGGGGEEETRYQVFSICLSLLGNAYSLDYSARTEVATNGFMMSLHRLLDQQEWTPPDPEGRLKLPFGQRGCEIKTKVVKCVANLGHDKICRDVMLKAGVGGSIIRMLGQYNQVFLRLEEDEEPLEEGVDCVKGGIRAIRILSSESNGNEDSKMCLIRSRAVLVIGGVLGWARNEELKLDVLRTLANLTDKVKMLPVERVEEIVCEEDGTKFLKLLVHLFGEAQANSKLLGAIIRCLNNFGMNPRIAEALGSLKIFNKGLEKLPEASEKTATEICRLLITLTKHSTVNQCVLYNCQEVWTFLEILRRDSLQDHHRWILHIYENAFEGTLKSLIRHGLIEHIHEHFKKEVEDCDYETLKNKISSLEERSCRVHSEFCQFIPTYRCDSPSYQQVQEERKQVLQNRAKGSGSTESDSGCSGVDSSSPSSSPARSWVSDDSSSEGGFRPLSPLSSSSDDEGCYSPVYSCSSLSPIYSDGCPDRATSPEISRISSPVDDPVDDINHTEFTSLTLTGDKNMENQKKSENMRSKCKKIVIMLNVLHKSTFLSPMPPSLCDVLPILLSFLLRGIVSLSPYKYKYEDYSKDCEMVHLGRRSFSVAFKILKAIFLDIQFFPFLVKNGAIGLISRLLPWDDTLKQIGSSEQMSELLATLRGTCNDTFGWREGHLMRSLHVIQEEDELEKISLVIPLLYRNNDYILRKFENKYSTWTRLFDLLMKTDDIPQSLFQDCILSITTLCQTIGIKYEPEEANTRPHLLQGSAHVPLSNVFQLTEDIESAKSNSTESVLVAFEDGTFATVVRSLLTDNSPVFLAMFDGHFREAGTQQVKIPNVSNQSFSILVEQIHLLSALKSSTSVEQKIEQCSKDSIELSVLFELISLSNQFLLDSVNERALNTLLSYYICPYSAPEIYSQALKFSSLMKSQSQLKGWDMDLNFVVLKYLFAGDLSMSSRCNAFRKIFDTVPPCQVVGDIRALVEFYSTRPKRM